MILLNGKIYADEIKDNIKKVVKNNVNACLAVIQVGNDTASNIYVKNKIKACEYVGIKSKTYQLSEYVTNKDLCILIDNLNCDDSVTGILVQLPLPAHLDSQLILQRINPNKDVDGFHVNNIGKIVTGNYNILPCTPHGIIKLLKYYDIDIEEKHCVIVGRSNIVGKPLAMLMLQEDATVTICHSKTKNLKEICKQADILITAIGKPKYFNKEYVKDGAVVVDVGIHKLDDGTMCGDVDYEDVKDIVSAITPVPKGVGAMTVAMLMWNCLCTAN